PYLGISMNRIASRPTTAKLSTLTTPPAKLSQLQGPAPRALPYRIFTPLHYEKNYAYPLLVWLHGAGGDETQLERIMPHVSLRNHVAVAPRAAGLVWEQTSGGIAHAERVIFEAIEAAQARLNIARQRIFIAGYQDGGAMALRVAMRHPRCFAGAATLCGPFPRGLQPLARLNE